MESLQINVVHGNEYLDESVGFVLFCMEQKNGNFHLDTIIK